MMFRHTGLLAGLASLALAIAPGAALGDANPGLPFYGYGSIVATPSSPIAGENATIVVTVGNSGADEATNVQVKLSFNDWGVSFMGWQEIGTQTIPSIPAGGTATATFNHVFQSRAHTCLEALIVGADENSDPNDDRGQINLEVIHAGETFSYGVPMRNEGDKPIDVLVLGHCREGDPVGGMVRCKPVDEIVHLEPGEEVLIPVELDLRGLPEGAVVEFVLDAFDTSGNGVHDREHVLLQVVKGTPRGEKRHVSASLSALAPSLPKGATANRYRNALKHLEDALNPRLWRDGSHLHRAGGAQVFAKEGFFDLAMTRLLPVLPGPVKFQVAEGLRRLVDVDRALAAAAADEAAALLLPAVQKFIDDGDAARRSGDYARAIHHYMKAWQTATR